jgi:NitT/TauT family transport system ATP-binding protein
VRNNIELALEARKLPKAQWADIVDRLLEQVGLAHAADSYPRQLSGGMQQRCQIARALAQDPDVLLMDEPFGALDAMTRQTLQDELLKLGRERGITIVFITHDLEEAIYLGDRVIALSANPGRIADIVDVDLPFPRNQLTTREDARFLALRHRLYAFLTGAH